MPYDLVSWVEPSTSDYRILLTARSMALLALNLFFGPSHLSATCPVGVTCPVHHIWRCLFS